MMTYDVKSLSNSQKRELIDEWIPNEKYRSILKRRLIDGVCYESLAEQFDMSVRQIKNIVYKSERRLLPHLK